MCLAFFCRLCSKMFSSNKLLWQHIGEHTFTHKVFVIAFAFVIAFVFVIVIVNVIVFVIDFHTFIPQCLDCSTGFKLKQHLVKHNCRVKRAERERKEKEGERMRMEQEQREKLREEEERRRRNRKEKRREMAEKKKEVWTEPEKEATKIEDVCEGLKVADNNLQQMMKVDNSLEKEEASDNTSDCGFAENESGYDSDKEINEEDDEDDLMEGNLQSERLKKNLEEFCYSSVFWLGYDE